MTTNEEREQQDAARPVHPAHRIEDDHRTLRRLLDRVAAATTRATLLSSLGALPKMLSDHFAVEEQPDGFYDDLRRRSPSLTPELTALCDEHRAILDGLDVLCRQLKGPTHGEQVADQVDESVMTDVARWLDTLREHERDESRMIGDVYYTDEGGHG